MGDMADHCLEQSLEDIFNPYIVSWPVSNPNVICSWLLSNKSHEQIIQLAKFGVYCAEQVNKEYFELYYLNRAKSILRASTKWRLSSKQINALGYFCVDLFYLVSNGSTFEDINEAYERIQALYAQENIKLQNGLQDEVNKIIWT